MARTVSRKIPQKADRELALRLPFGCHGSSVLPLVEVDCYNIELRTRRRFIGDRANKKAFAGLVEKWRRIADREGEDPFDGPPGKPPDRKKLEQTLLRGKPEAAAIVQTAIDEFSGRLVEVIERYMELPEWEKVERIYIGGGMRGSRIGELAIALAQTALYKKKTRINLRPIHADPDEAGLIGAAFLAPHWIFAGYDGMLAVDIGGTNIRAGVLKFHRKKAGGFKSVSVARLVKWEHAEENPDREEIVGNLIALLKKLVRWSRRKGFRLAPFLGVGCPGRIRVDGAIDRGSQNLPGNWESGRFNLPTHLRENLRIAPGHETVVIMHNDAVIQGLSELTYARAKNWAVLTIGTGLGNAKFTSKISGRGK